MKMNGNQKTKMKSQRDGTLRDTETLTTPSERSFIPDTFDDDALMTMMLLLLLRLLLLMQIQ